MTVGNENRLTLYGTITAIERKGNNTITEVVVQYETDGLLYNVFCYFLGALDAKYQKGTNVKIYAQVSSEGYEVGGVTKWETKVWGNDIVEWIP